MEHETFWELVRDPAHWQFEILAEILSTGLFGALIWPWLKKWFRHHKEDDDKLHDLENRVSLLEEKGDI